MNRLRKLLFHVEMLDSAVDQKRTFFGPIIGHVRRFQQLLLESPEGLTQGELLLLARAVDLFFDKWRPSRTNSSVIFIPPREIAAMDWTVKEINALVGELARMPESAFRRLLRPAKSPSAKKGFEAVRRLMAPPEKTKRRIGFVQ
ncbi:MAG: hypothetical protein HY748_01600 [Elusimicrobia bacterium]|nr:hypothetical protein [Elusimicrobiota bacterium]